MPAENVLRVANMIDHAILKPSTTDDHLVEALKGVQKIPLASVCIQPHMIPIAKDWREGSQWKLGTVAAFPQGMMTTTSKLREIDHSIALGAEEIDFVINIGKALSRDWKYLEKEVSGITQLCHDADVSCKVIFETDYIHEESLIRELCKIAVTAGTDFVKTSTGFGFVKDEKGQYRSRGARIELVDIMIDSVRSTETEVKASGGIQTLDQLETFAKMGVRRIGTSSTLSILEELPGTL